MSEGRGLVLAFDTASEYIALAVGRRCGDGIELVATGDREARREANVRLLPSIDELFAANGLSKADVEAVVVGLGPGSFTGVRIGVASAKGIARGLGVPVYGVSTLDAIAWGAWLAGVRGQVGVIADAMRGEVYPARFTLNDEGALRLDPHRVAKAPVVSVVWRGAQELPLLLGDGLYKFADKFAGFSLLDEPLWRPGGAGLLRAFASAEQNGAAGDGEAGTLLPIYTRLSDAEENERKRLAGTGEVAQGALVEVPRSGVADPARLEQVIYRPLAAGDIEQLATLEAELFGSTAWTAGMLANEPGKNDRSWWMAFVGDALVGYAGGWVIDGDMQLLRIGVHPSYRRRGIGRSLAMHLSADATALAASTISLEVRASNVVARELYASLGFSVQGVRPGYYDAETDGSSREDAVIMAAHLPLGFGSSGDGTGDVSGSKLAKGEIRSGGFSCGTRKERSNRSDWRVTPKSGHARRLAVPFDSALHCRISLPKPPTRISRSHLLPDTSPVPSPALIHPLVLAIETSCDETAIAIMDGDGSLLANVVASQVDFHARFGGVVPEIASRKHTEVIVGVLDEALEQAGLRLADLDAIAVTYAPGLIGALVVGVAFAKGLAWAAGKPLIRVNHLEGHIYANRLEGDALQPPFITALLSGGHTMLVHVRAWGDYRILGQTLDDAVGEAFDKVAKALGLGYPGGPVISRLAERGNAAAIDFPRALMHSHDYAFSLSGLKTAVITYIRQQQAAGVDLDLPDVAASFQQAVIDVQVKKALDALDETGCDTFALGGGVAANRALRDAYAQAMGAHGIRVIFPPAVACTDNAAMIAEVALERYGQGRFASLSDDAYAQADLQEVY